MRNHFLRAVPKGGNLQYVGGQTGVNTAESITPTFDLTSLTGGLASSPSSGDLVVCSVTFANSTDRDITCTTSGYTEVADLFRTGPESSQMAVYYKRLSSAETTVSFNLGIGRDSVFVVHVWRGSDATTPIDVTTTTATASARPNSPSITTVSNNCVILAIGAQAMTDTDPFTSLTVPSGMSNFLTANRVTVARNSRITLGIASFLQTSAGAYDPATFGGGNSSGPSCSATVAIRSS